MEEIAICSSCSKEVIGRKNIEKQFGYRLVLNIPMSICKECLMLGTICNNVDCEKWGQDYPKCYYESKCHNNKA